MLRLLGTFQTLSHVMLATPPDRSKLLYRNGNVAGSIGPLPICFLGHQLLVAGGSGFTAFYDADIDQPIERPTPRLQTSERQRWPVGRGTKTSNEIFQRNAPLNECSLRLKSDDGRRKNRITALPIGQCGAFFLSERPVPNPRAPNWPFLFHSTRVIAQIRCWWSSSSSTHPSPSSPPLRGGVN